MKFTSFVAGTALLFGLAVTAIPANAANENAINEKRAPIRGDKYAKYWPGSMGPHAEAEAEPEAEPIRGDRYAKYWPGSMGPSAEKRDAAPEAEPIRGDKYAKYWPGSMGPDAET